MLTFAQAKDSRLNRISGVCPTTEEFTQYLNDATRELMMRGQWWNTVRRMTGCVYDNCIVWPRQVGTVLAINRCNHSIPPRNQWFGFDPVLPIDVINHNKNFGFQSGTGSGCWGEIAAQDLGVTAVFNQIPCLNDRFLRFYPTRQADSGKHITIFGLDGNGQVIRAVRDDGTYQDGLVLTLAIPFVQTTIAIRSVTHVIKEETQGTVFGYQFDGQNQFPLASYDPSETLPEYRKEALRGGGFPFQTLMGNPACCGPKQITALIKLKFIPVANDDDLVLIDNLDALAQAIQSIKQSDAYDHNGAEAAMARAVHTLNLDLRQKLPIDQTPTRVHYQGTTSYRWNTVGKII